MRVLPTGDQILLEIEKAKLGNINTDSMKTGQEWATVKAVGPDVKGLYKAGDKVFVKAWAVDSILYEGKDYYFTSEERKGIVAVLK